MDLFQHHNQKLKPLRMMSTSAAATLLHFISSSSKSPFMYCVLSSPSFSIGSPAFKSATRYSLPRAFRERIPVSLPSRKTKTLHKAVRGVYSTTDMADRSPVLLFDVMGTIVRDPFYEDMPAFFGITFKELLQIKHPTAWIEFEKGLITEEELVLKFFMDKRSFDFNGLKACVANGYAYLEGVEALLVRLKSKGYEMHAFTNYPTWYKLIEEKLELSKYLSWTFVSCHTGKRKPDLEAFIDAATRLGVNPADIIFIDDQSRNVEAATQIGMTGLTFQGADRLQGDLLALGLTF